MISAWKRFLNKNECGLDPSGQNGVASVPPGIQKLDKELQRKFAKGVNYNMKIVIKGDARVGKSSLFLRLKGYGFVDDYIPTENLNVTSLNWNYKATDDIVKIDLWEAVDTTVRKSINYVDLKLDNRVATPSPTNGQSENDSNFFKAKSISNATITTTKLSMNGCSDHPIPESAKQSLAELSENLDVYKNTDAVLLVLDMTKLWTFKYIQAELPKIPKQIPVLVIANHRDQGHHRAVSAEQITSFIEGLDRSPCDGTVMYTESSMKNGFGLKLIEKFFNIPFLKLQETTLLKQLEINRYDYMSTKEELEIMQDSTSREYEQYLDMETIRRRQQADAMSPVNAGLRQLDETTREQIRKATISSDELDKNKNIKSLESCEYDRQTEAQQMANQKFVNDRLPSIVMGAKCPLPETKAIQMNKIQQPVASQSSKVELVHGEEQSDESDDEDEVPRANPLVASYQSDLDSDD